MSTAWADAITVDELDDDPYPVYARMRREAPVCFVPAVGLWFVTRWDDVAFATSNPELIDSSVTPSPAAATPRTIGPCSPPRGTPCSSSAV